MKRHLVMAASIAALAGLLPATGAATPTSKQDRLNAAAACTSLEASDAAAFAGLYGTGKRAHRTCVAQWLRTSHAARHAALATCKAQMRGKSRKALNACVDTRTAAAVTTRVRTTQNAARACRAERADPNFAAAHDGKTFAEFYGRNANDRNAFGKCVSTKAKAQRGDHGADRVQQFRVVLSSLNASGVTGTARLTLRGDQLTVRLTARGLETGKEHAQHIHGLSDSSANATCPSTAADTNADGRISLSEGVPFYGGVLFGLTPFGTPTTSTLRFAATYTLTAAQLASLQPLTNRTIVLHGLTVGGAYDASLPVACGEIVAAS